MHANFTALCRRLTLIVAFSTAALPLAAAFGQSAQPTDRNAGATDGLTEIVVTARRRTENLQNVPLAVTAIGAAAIETQNITSLADLSGAVPNMKISNDRATSSTINVYIRGVGQS